jgi:hypothetical protein
MHQITLVPSQCEQCTLDGLVLTVQTSIISAFSLAGGQMHCCCSHLCCCTATSISHPNVLVTYHISTMTISERSALARSWLGDSATPEGVGEGLDDAGEDDKDGTNSDSASDSSDGAPPGQMLETWLIMEVWSALEAQQALSAGDKVPV